VQAISYPESRRSNPAVTSLARAVPNVKAGRHDLSTKSPRKRLSHSNKNPGEFFDRDGRRFASLSQRHQPCVGMAPREGTEHSMDRTIYTAIAKATDNDEGSIVTACSCVPSSPKLKLCITTRYHLPDKGVSAKLSDHVHSPLSLNDTRRSSSQERKSDPGHRTCSKPTSLSQTIPVTVAAPHNANKRDQSARQQTRGGTDISLDGDTTMDGLTSPRSRDC